MGLDIQDCFNNLICPLLIAYLALQGRATKRSGSSKTQSVS